MRNYFKIVQDIFEKKRLDDFVAKNGEDEINKLKQYVNIAVEGKRCFVLGNGPSLTVEILEKLHKSNEVCFAANKIYKVFGRTNWRPDYYTCTDSLVFKQNAKEILNSIDCPKFISFQSSFFIKKKTDDIVFLNYGGRPLRFPEFGKRIPSGGTVTFVMIYLAWMMGYREIYLLGCDHSYGAFDNQTTGRIISGESASGDYLCKDYMKKGEKMKVGDLDKANQGYECVRDYIESHGGVIKNATDGGFLEVFERISLNEIIEYGQ